MDANEIRKAAYDTMFSTVIELATDSEVIHSKQLEWLPGRKELFQVVWWDEGKEKHIQKFTAILPAIDFFLQQMPR